MLRMLPLGDAVTSKSWLRLVVTLALCLLLVVLPLIFGFEHRLINGVMFVAIFALLSLGLNVVVGNTGLLELGYVTFLATGAVTTFNLLLWENAAGEHPFADSSVLYLVVILASGLLCAVLGLVRGIPTLKLTGDYYAIVTLGLAEIAYLVFLNSEFTGGAFGMKLSAVTRPTLFGDRVYYDTPQFYYLVLASLGLTLLVMDRLNRSRTGRAWAAIRLDEVAARASGINISKNKMIAFAISGFFGGVGGSLYAVWIGTVATKSLDVWQSILILCAVVLGGMGSLRGVLLGSLILFPLREVLREEIGGFRVPPEASYLIYGLLLILVMRFRPEGLLPRSVGGVRRHLTEAEIAAVRSSTPALFVLDAGAVAAAAAKAQAQAQAPTNTYVPPPAALLDSKGETVIDEGDDDDEAAAEVPATGDAPTEVAGSTDGPPSDAPPTDHKPEEGDDADNGKSSESERLIAERARISERLKASRVRHEGGATILETQDLCRYFGGVKATEKVNIRVRTGQITALIGPNGAGKTTAFNAITGIFPPTTGDVVFHHPELGDRSLVGLSPDQICELGVARTFQNIRLFPDLPVVENVKVGFNSRTAGGVLGGLVGREGIKPSGDVLGMITGALRVGFDPHLWGGVLGSIFRLPSMLREEDDIHAAALRYLDFVGLLESAYDQATNLPYGDQRRLEIARALATHPKLLLLDEPAAGMNPTETEALMTLIRRICECGGTVFLIEHDMKLVMNISDYIYVMDHGELICEGPPESVQKDPKVIEAYLGVQEDHA